jgi:hypothetical protein
MNKTELIKGLIRDDVVNIESGEMSWWIETILNDGFLGYRNMTLKQLQQEYDERELENQFSVNN